MLWYVYACYSKDSDWQCLWLISDDIWWHYVRHEWLSIVVWGSNFANKQSEFCCVERRSWPGSVQSQLRWTWLCPSQQSTTHWFCHQLWSKYCIVLHFRLLFNSVFTRLMPGKLKEFCSSHTDLSHSFWVWCSELRSSPAFSKRSGCYYLKSAWLA